MSTRLQIRRGVKVSDHGRARAKICGAFDAQGDQWPGKPCAWSAIECDRSRIRVGRAPEGKRNELNQGRRASHEKEARARPGAYRRRHAVACGGIRWGVEAGNVAGPAPRECPERPARHTLLRP